jgi:hypothetical protein
LEPGEERHVRFTVTVDALRFFRAERLAAAEEIWEPGTFIVHVGPNSQALSSAAVEWQTGE